MCSKQTKNRHFVQKKKAKEYGEITNTKAANNFYFLPERNSHPHKQIIVMQDQ
jgi:hypothetical protein